MADHVPLPGSRRPRPRNAERGAELASDEHIEVTVTLAGPDLPDAVGGKPLSREELASGYGVDAETIRKVSDQLEKFGLVVEETSALTRSLRLSGTVAQMEAAFCPGLAIYRSAEQGEFRGREGELQIPAELEGLVTGVFGLDQRRVARRRAEAGTAALVEPVSPAQLAGHYNFPPGSGAGQTVAIAEFRRRLLLRRPVRLLRQAGERHPESQHGRRERDPGTHPRADTATAGTRT